MYISTPALNRGSKSWVNSQDLLPFAWFLLVDFSLTISIDDTTGNARSGAKKYRTRSRKKVSGRRFKTWSVGLVEAETFFVWPYRNSFFVQNYRFLHHGDQNISWWKMCRWRAVNFKIHLRSSDMKSDCIWRSISIQYVQIEPGVNSDLGNGSF